jgi:DNA phosphorothioation-dependent restriction protein DptH
MLYLFSILKVKRKKKLFKIKSLEKHYSLIKFGGDKVLIYVRDKAFWKLLSRI